MIAFGWKYSHDSGFVASQKWQKRKENFHWLPILGIDPLPFIAALWSRASEICITALFVTLTLTASFLFEELVNRADDMKEMSNNITNSSDSLSVKLEQWRHHFVLINRFINKINNCYGLILLLQTAYGFAVPIFEFNKILQSRNTPFPRYFFEFAHTVLRFFIILIPSYLLTQQVKNFYSGI